MGNSHIRKFMVTVECDFCGDFPDRFYEVLFNEALEYLDELSGRNIFSYGACFREVVNSPFSEDLEVPF